MRWRLFLAQSGWGEWSAAPDYYQNSARFRWNKDEIAARQLALLPPLELLKRVRVFLLDSDGDATLAREFAPLRGFARHQLCCPVGAAVMNSGNKFFNGICKAIFPTSAKEKARLKIDIQNARRDSVDKWLIGGRCSCFGPSATQFCDWTRQYFAPELDENYLKRCSAAAHWSNRDFAHRCCRLASNATRTSRSVAAIARLVARQSHARANRSVVARRLICLMRAKLAFSI